MIRIKGKENPGKYSGKVLKKFFDEPEAFK